MPNVELQTYLATLPPQQREAISKLPEAQQISIMSENFNTTKTSSANEQMFDFEQDASMGLALEKNPSTEKPVSNENPVVENEELPNEEPKVTRYVIQNNTGLHYYANLQGTARKETDPSYNEIELKHELEILEKNNSEKILKNLPVGETIILDGEINTSEMKDAQQSIQAYTKGQQYVQNQAVLMKQEEERLENLEIEKQKQLTGQALKQSVVDTMKENYKAASQQFGNQMKEDGWAGDVADGVSILWNNSLWNATGNRAKLVNQDLEEYRKNTIALSQATKDGSFEKKFKEIYNVNYNENNIKDYNVKENKLKEISLSTTINETIDKNFGNSLKMDKENYGVYKDHVEVLNSPTGTFNKITPKEFLLSSAQNRLTKIIGKETLNNLGKQAGIDLDSASDKEKYNFYTSLMTKMQDSTKEDLKTKLNGKKPEDYLKEYETASKKAFGSENNIQERVSRYNNSQNFGASVVKGITKTAVVAGATALVLASGGTATPLVVGGLTAATSVGIEISDKATNNVKGDLDSEAIQTIVGNGLIEGAFAYGGGKLIKSLEGINTFSGKNAQKAWQIASNGVAGTVEGTTYDLVKGGFDNVTAQTVLARTIISSTLGNAKAFTNNKSLLTGVKYTKTITTYTALNEIRESMNAQAKTDPKAKEILNWLEANPQEFEKIVANEFKNIQ